MKKRIIAVLAVAALVALIGVSSLAATTAPDMGSVMADAFTGMVADILTSMGLIVPIALGVFGALWAAKMGLKFFKSFSGGASA